MTCGKHQIKYTYILSSRNLKIEKNDIWPIMGCKTVTKYNCKINFLHPVKYTSLKTSVNIEISQLELNEEKTQ